MRRLVAIFVVVMFAVANLGSVRAQQASAPEQDAKNGAPPPANPLKVAILHWYQANRTASFKVGKQPYGVAFDGENIWSANYEDGTVSEVRASDGANLGTFQVGGNPIGIAFDGANMWVTDNGSNTVTKLRASDGKSLGTFQVGNEPWWLAFDGENLWVANFGDGTVTKLRASDGKSLGTFNTNGAIAVAFDGTYVWVSTYAGYVTRLKKDGSNAGSFKVGSRPIGIAFDGANIWVANNEGTSVTKLRAKDGATLGTFLYGGAPYGVAFDGTNIWVTGSPNVVEYRASDGAVIDAVQIPNSSTAGIAFDGADIWVAATFDNAVHKF
jgi:glutamine cyclotransferase